MKKNVVGITRAIPFYGETNYSPLKVRSRNLDPRLATMKRHTAAAANPQTHSFADMPATSS
jgi:hypothetical protein